MNDNEITRTIPFENRLIYYKRKIENFFSTYKNQSDGEDCLEICLIRDGYRTVLKAEEEINRLQAEIERLKEIDIRKAKDLRPLITKTIKSEARKEFAERLCEGRVSNDPVVIAVKVELEMMDGKENGSEKVQKKSNQGIVAE